MGAWVFTDRQSRWWRASMCAFWVGGAHLAIVAKNSKSLLKTGPNPCTAQWCMGGPKYHRKSLELFPRPMAPTVRLTLGQEGVWGALLLNAVVLKCCKHCGQALLEVMETCSSNVKIFLDISGNVSPMPMPSGCHPCHRHCIARPAHCDRPFYGQTRIVEWILTKLCLHGAK